MDTENLKKVIEECETIEVEFKQSFHSFQDIAKVICAFANTQGGLLILGVDDKGHIEGIKENLDTVQQKISQSNATIHPNPLINVEVHTINKKKLVVVIIHKADSSVFHSVGGIIYIRLGSTIQKLEGQSIVEFLRNRQILLFEELIDSTAKIDDIDLNKIKAYLDMREQRDYLKSHSLKDFLLSKRLASLQPDLKIKNSSLLFFAKEPQSFLPYTQIKLVRFDGDKPIKVMAYEEAKGSLPQMIEQSLNFVRRFIAKEFVIKEIKRKEIPLLPEDAVRETIINAIAHRDYFNKNEIQISIFDNRFEITNPGGLPEGMTKELLGALSIQRNPLIYQFLKDYGYMEGIGSGISKIYKAMKDEGLEDPEFILTKEFFRVILKMGNVVTKTKEVISKRQQKALDFLKKNKKMKAKDYASVNKVSGPTAVKDLNELGKKGYLKKIGSYRGAYYILNENN